MNKPESDWIKHWDVVGTSGKTHVVSQRRDGLLGCECPAFRFQKKPLEKRKQCQHILLKRIELQGLGENVLSPEPEEKEVQRHVRFRD